MASKHKIEFDNFNAEKYFKLIDYTENNSKNKKTVTKPIKNTSNMDCYVKKNEIISTTELLKEELMNYYEDTPDSFYRRPCRSDCINSCCNFKEDYKNETIVEMDES